jgi:cyclic beta-1,2-glucan synthetase
MTPAPWVNVLANPHLRHAGLESGAAYTWVENAHEFRLTPWSNDPVQDPPAKPSTSAMSRPASSGRPRRLPARGADALCHPPRLRLHGVRTHGKRHRLRVVGLCGDGRPGEIQVLKLRNVSGASPPPCPSPATGNGCWATCGKTACCTCRPRWTSRPARLLARNGYNTEFPGASSSWMSTIPRARSPATGRSSSAATAAWPTGRPEARAPFRQSRRGTGPVRRGAGRVRLPEGQERETSFRLGVGRERSRCAELIHGSASPTPAAGARRRLGILESHPRRDQCRHPDPAVNVMANGWLLYQT